MVLVLLSISNTKRGSKPFCQGQQGKKEKEGRSEAKNNCKRQLQHKGKQDAAIQAYDMLLHRLHVGSRSGAGAREPSLRQKQLQTWGLPEQSPNRTLHQPNQDLGREFGY